MRKIAFCGAVIWLCTLSGTLLAQEYNWEEIGRENLNCQAVLVSAQNNKIIFAGKPGNILKSENAGKSWRRVLAVKGRDININAFTMEHNDIYAATDNGLYRSNNLGERWERIFRGKSESENKATAVASSGQIIFLGTKAGLFISKDGGGSWYKQQTGTDSGSILNIALVRKEKPLVYLASAHGIYKSVDNGADWERIYASEFRRNANEITDQNESDEPIQPDRLTEINFVLPDLRSSNALYFSCTKGVYRSSNQGEGWDKLTEYGLLNRDVKMICLGSNAELYALTASGVFLFTGERWQEVSIGLAAGRLNYLALDKMDNIYISGEKGIYRANLKSVSNFVPTAILQEYLKNEPQIRDVQSAAIKYAEVSPEKIKQWRSGAAIKAWLPKVSVGIDRNTTDLWHWEGGSTTKTDDDILRKGNDSLDWDVALSWDLSDLIWNDAQTSIDVRSKLMVELRDDILDQVNKLYYERLRVKSELDSLAIEDKHKRFQKQLKIEELTASLDSLTAGFYSDQLRKMQG